MHRILFGAMILTQLTGVMGHRAGAAQGIPADARFACPMETHPDQADSAEQGAYFSDTPGQCPWCGMELKPLENLEWVRIRKAASGADVAYTCPDHQHVYSDKSGECPRCGKLLRPFKVMYTCPNPEHSGVVSVVPGNCPRCERGMAAFRGVWLAEDMAEANVPPYPGPAETAQYRCPIHPLVHSDTPANCSICGAPLEATRSANGSEAPSVPAGARYVCPMEECWQFSPEPADCPTCGMAMKPIDAVPWAKERVEARRRSRPSKGFVCPMHPDTARSDQPGTCDICGMRLVAESRFERPADAPSQIAAQVNYITEHYLELQRLLAADKTRDVARHVLGIAAAADELLTHAADPSVETSAELKSAVESLRRSALKITGTSLERDRVVFVELSRAMTTLIDEARPDRNRWPKLYIFHCPMSKGDWIQTGADKANPYYGFSMLKCGELRKVD